MFKTRKYLALSLIALLLSANFAFAQNYGGSYIQADISSQRISSGTLMKIRVENPINSLNSRKGDPLLATLIEDIKVNNKIVLPAGTIIRGRLTQAKPHSRLSRGGELGIEFDHVVTPIGRQIPFSAQITEFKYLGQDGTLTAGGGYVNALENNLDKSVDLISKTTDYGIKKGMSVGYGVPVVLTAPLAFAGSGAVGCGLFFVRSVKSLYKKGENVKIQPGDIIEVSIKESLDIPVN